jgi:hypothetical protein
MKKIILTILVLVASLGQAQVGIGTTSPDASAILDLSSTSKGILIPRMTSEERNAIASPTEGLLIFNSATSQFEAFRKEVLPEQNMLDYYLNYVSNGTYSITGGDGAWQEFTATQTGLITKIVMYQSNPMQTPSTTFEVGMNVYEGVTSTNGSSLSGGTIIGTTSTILPTNSTMALREYVFASPISVTANTKYWFKVTNISSEVDYYASTGYHQSDVYASNNTWIGGYNRDLLFKVFYSPVGAAAWRKM